MAAVHHVARCAQHGSTKSSKCGFCSCRSLIILVCSLGVALVLIPSAVLTLSSVFASIMWRIECATATTEWFTNHPNTTVISSDSNEYERCQWFQWFLYVTGNLLGLGNPLTDVGPQSGDTFGQMIDIVIATWSLAITGSVVGLIGGLAALEGLVARMNAGISASASYGMLRVSGPLSGSSSRITPEGGKAGDAPQSNYQEADEDGGKGAKLVMLESGKFDLLVEQVSTLAKAVERQQRMLEQVISTSAYNEQVHAFREA